MQHKDQTQLLKELKNLVKKVKVGDKFYHFKHPDQFYKIIAIGFIEASEKPCVVYQGEYGERITWVRTEKEFFSKVTLEGGKIVDRFTRVKI